MVPALGPDRLRPVRVLVWTEAAAQGIQALLCIHRNKSSCSISTHQHILIFRFLCLKNKNSALVVFTTYTQKHPSIEDGPPFVQPLLNFIWFLLLALDG